MRTRGWFFAAAVAAALSLTSTPAFAFERRVPVGFFGATADPAVEATFALAGASGLETARHPLRWHPSQPGKLKDPDVSIYDETQRRFARNGMRWLALLDTTPTWASRSPGTAVLGPKPAEDPTYLGPDNDTAPLDPADYARFARAVIARYGPGGVFWSDDDFHQNVPELPIREVEIYNEPELEPSWDGAHYATVFTAARNAIRDQLAAQGEPRDAVRVISAGSTDYDGPFARAVLSDPDFQPDAYGFHAYSNELDVLLTAVQRMRRSLDGGLGTVARPNTPIAVTETGWYEVEGTEDNATGAEITEAKRSAHYAEIPNALARTNCAIALVSTFMWQQPHLASRPRWGIVDASGAARQPAGDAYSLQALRFRGDDAVHPAPRKTLRLCGWRGLPDQDGDGVPDQDDLRPFDAANTASPVAEGTPPDETQWSEPPAPFTARAASSALGIGPVNESVLQAWRADALRAAATGGAENAMEIIPWQRVQPTAASAKAGTFDWTSTDWVVRRLAMAGRHIAGTPSPVPGPTASSLLQAPTRPMRLVPVLSGYPAGWENPTRFTAEYSSVVESYGRFVAAFASRYGRGGSFWSDNADLEPLPVVRYAIWNAPNRRPADVAHGGWSNSLTRSGTEYAQLYAQARNRIRSVDSLAEVAVGPLSKVITTGSLPDTPAGTFAANVATALAPARPDAVASWPGDIMGSFDDVASAVDDIRDALDSRASAVGVPIWVGNFGFAKGSSTSANTARRDALRRTLELVLTDCAVEGVYVKGLEDGLVPLFAVNPAITGDPLYDPAFDSEFRDTVRLLRGRGPVAPPAGTVSECAWR